MIKNRKIKNSHRRVLRPADVGELHQPRVAGLLLALKEARPVPLGDDRRDHLGNALARERHTLRQHLVDQNPEAGHVVLRGGGSEWVGSGGGRRGERGAGEAAGIRGGGG